MGRIRKRSAKKAASDHHVLENKIVIKKDMASQSDIQRQENRQSRRNELLRRVMISLILIFVLMAGSVYIYTKSLLTSVNHESQDEKEIVMQEEKFDTDENDSSSGFEKINPNEVQWNNSGDIKKVNGITNILLIADAQDGDEGALRGRSDVIIIVTINTNDKTLKMTSIMRDTYVQIPGCRDNRINTAYRTGDVPLLEKTIEQNFNISVEGYIKVDFKGFTEIIDQLGGVEITITEEEARWLNKGNHIMDPESRDVEAGTHRLNGSQVLGYCIIRRVDTVDGLPYDFGRVWRQKLVLTSLFNQYKDESITKILTLAPGILSKITTDLPENKILSLVMTALDLEVNEIQTLSVPIAGSYEGKMIRGMAVLVPDLKKNIKALDSFIYGNNKQKSEEFDVSEYEITFSLTESNFQLKSIDQETEKAFDVMKGYSKLTLSDIRRAMFQLEKKS